MSNPVTQPAAPADVGQPMWAQRSEPTDARARAALALREVVGQLLQADAPPAEFDAAADALDQLSARLRSWPVRESTPPVTSGYLGHRAFLLPGVEYDISDPDRFVARTTFNIGYEGPSGRVHGGIVAYLFDGCFGLAFGHFGIVSSVTGTMTVKYLAATPLDYELTVTCRLDRIEGRKCFLVADLTADGTTTATAEAIMIMPATAIQPGAAQDG